MTDPAILAEMRSVLYDCSGLRRAIENQGIAADFPFKIPAKWRGIARDELIRMHQAKLAVHRTLIRSILKESEYVSIRDAVNRQLDSEEGSFIITPQDVSQVKSHLQPPPSIGSSPSVVSQPSDETDIMSVVLNIESRGPHHAGLLAALREVI